MKFKAKIDIGLKRDYLDPESETVRRTLLDLNFPVTGVRTRKVYEIVVDSVTKKEAENIARTMCSRLLVNPTKDEFEIEVVPIGNGVSAEA